MTTLMNTKSARAENEILPLIDIYSFKEISEKTDISMFMIKKIAKQNGKIDLKHKNEKHKWYAKLYNKLNEIKNGDLKLDDYINEIKLKLN